jgi:hypothetical protein
LEENLKNRAAQHIRELTDLREQVRTLMGYHFLVMLNLE